MNPDSSSVVSIRSFAHVNDRGLRAVVPRSSLIGAWDMSRANELGVARSCVRAHRVRAR
jgi:hypothetical protein